MVDLGDRERGRLVGPHDRFERDAVVREQRLEPPAEAIGGDPPEVRDRLPEPADRARGVERAAAGMAAKVIAVALDHEVVQRFPGHEDHGRSSPLPTAIAKHLIRMGNVSRRARFVPRECGNVRDRDRRAHAEMSVDPRAGTLPEQSDLIDVDRLLAAYHEQPDPANRVAFGTSGHRGSSLAGTFTEAHVLAISEAVCRYREAQGIDGPLFLGRDTHALSEPASETIVEVLAAHGVDVVVDAGDGATPTPVISHAILGHNRGDGRGTADGIVVTPSHNPPADGGFKYNPPSGGPADTDVTGWIEQEANAAARRRARRREAHVGAGHASTGGTT